MKRLNITSYGALLVLVVLFSACSVHDENTSSPNASTPQQANNNSATQPQIAQNSAPAEALGTTPPAVQPLTAPPAPAKKPAAITATPAKASDTSADTNAPAPKLVIPEKKVDFGKQPQDKTLVRAIVVKNGGRANLNIESVVPS